MRNKTGLPEHVIAACERTRQLDALDVKTGKRSSDYFHFIPRKMAQESVPIFPAKYRRSKR